MSQFRPNRVIQVNQHRTSPHGRILAHPTVWSFCAMRDNRAGWTLRIVVGVSWVLRTWMINRYVFNFFAPIFAWNVVYVARKATVLEFVGCLIMVANSSTLPFSMLTYLVILIVWGITRVRVVSSTDNRNVVLVRLGTIARNNEKTGRTRSSITSRFEWLLWI